MITVALCSLLYFCVFRLQREVVERQSCLKQKLVMCVVELYMFLPMSHNLKAPEVNDDKFVSSLCISKMLPLGSVEMAQSVTLMSCKQEGLSLIPQTHI